MYDDLDEVRGDCADRLGRAGRDRHSPMHTPVVVTSDIEARVMVLREFDPEAWTVRFHTDARAPKVAAIAQDPRIGLVFYDKPEKIQIRATGQGRIVREGSVVEQAWQAGSNFARRCYLGNGPGTRGEEPLSGLPAQFEGVEPTDAELEPARENFAVLTIALFTLDWLYLAHDGHRRARFERRGEAWNGQWISP